MQLYVLGFLFDDKGTKVALIKKNRSPWQEGKLNGIGGKVDSGEYKEAAMVREFQEETGVPTEGWEEFGQIGASEYRIYLFRKFDTYALSGIQTSSDEEIIVADLYNLFSDDQKEVDYDLIPNLNWIIPMALDPEQYYSDIELK